MELLIEFLTSFDIFDTESDYFYKYAFLIAANKSTPAKHFVTQRHHIIPKCFFKIHGLPIDNSAKNLVNLKYSDHLLAHFYLSKCIKDPELSIKMFVTLFFMGLSDLNVEQILKDEDIDNWYMTMKKEAGKRHSQRTKGKMPIPWNKGGNCYTEEQLTRLRANFKKLNTKYWLNKHLPQEMKQKISATLKGTQLSDETKLKISNSCKERGIGVGAANGMYGVKTMTNGEISVLVKGADIDTYLQNGYIFGSLCKIKNLDTGEIYWNANDAAKKLNLSVGQIHKILGKQHKKLCAQYQLIRINE